MSSGRAREGITAAGGIAPRPHGNRLSCLTSIEQEVALAAGAGAPLHEVAYSLFLSSRTARLLETSAMAKLGVETAAQLAMALAPERSPDSRDQHRPGI
jgi:DNA-binding NarL/FixJ family response regulator